TERDGSLSETFVKKLDNNRVNEVKTGNWIRVYCNDTQSEFAYVKVNGTEVELVRNSEGMARTAWVQANGRTVIDTHVVTPCRAKTNPTYDDRKHIVAGNVYVEVDGQKYTDVIVYAGQTVKLVAEPETGYVFDHFEKFYALTMAADGIVLEGDTYTFTEADARENFILFKGVFKEDENQKVYVLRGSTAWLVDSDGNPVTDTSSAMGTVLFRLGDGSLVPETTALEGQSVRLEISVATQEIADNYEVYGFCLMSGFPNAKIPANYEVKAADADTDDVIWINGLMRAKGLGVGELVADGALAYDAETMTLTAPAGIAVYNVSGRLVVSTDEPTLSTAALPRGVYVAVSGGNTIKFVK
ncbi:MAG: T9SS type A sorting domain-containing protein, partial [Muribaculaceae bacterium]|nr:T9SS type A sorting domain-containing protein [Muribaculaceae bacterium]